jgi:acetyl/propionyl-CoA carboxylase alpha subunit
MNINRLLIANRGEIAVRIIRTCQLLGIETVLVASEADLDSVPARMADNLINIGPAPTQQSYLNIDNVIQAAKQSQADAVHPDTASCLRTLLLHRPALKMTSFLLVPPSNSLMLSAIN